MLTNDELESAMQEQMYMLGHAHAPDQPYGHSMDPQSIAHMHNMLHSQHLHQYHALHRGAYTPHVDETHTDTRDIVVDNVTSRSFNAVNAVPSSELLQFLAQETRLFNLHLKSACEQYERDSKLPPSLFGIKAIRSVQKASGKKATAGEKRKPTSFNLYIKKRIREIKAAEPDNDEKYTTIFKRVVVEWGNMTTAQKKAFAEQIASEEAGTSGKNNGSTKSK